VPFAVFAEVIAAALLHATWNAIVKSASDKFLTTMMVTASAAVVAVLVLPFLRPPAPPSWLCLTVSMVFQLAYFLLIARTYQVADMSLAYPLMRGTAPLLVAIVSVFRVGDALSPTAWLGVIGICTGIFTIAAGAGNSRKGVGLSLLNAVVIGGYTLVDGIGVRRSGSPAAYTLWVFLLTGVPLTAWVICTRGASFVPYFARHWRLGLIGGIGATASYGLALWAMTLAPVAVVAALRETSILFGIVIAGLALKEHIGLRRMIAACIIAASAVVLRLG
jgi:drug/metabolite transporter (DMT)-like permease